MPRKNPAMKTDVTKIRLEINTDESRIADICRDYWGLDGSGNFTIKVNDIATKFNIDSMDILPLVNTYSLAFSTSIQCKKCQVFYQFSRRAQVKYQKAYIGETWRCQACSEAQTDNVPEEIGPARRTHRGIITRGSINGEPCDTMVPHRVNNIGKLLYSVVKKLEENYRAQKQNLAFHETNFASLIGNLLVVSARRTGRTNEFMGLDIGIRLAIDEKIPILLIYSSGSGERIVERILCKESRIDPLLLRDGNLGTREWIVLTRVIADLAEAPINIVKLDNPVSSDPATMIAAWRSNNYYLP